MVAAEASELDDVADALRQQALVNAPGGLKPGNKRGSLCHLLGSFLISLFYHPVLIYHPDT